MTQILKTIDDETVCLDLLTSSQLEKSFKNKPNLIMDASFKSFDKDADLSINEGEWKTLLKALFRNDKGIPYPIDDYLASDLF